MGRHVRSVSVWLLAIAAMPAAAPSRAEENRFFLQGGERLVFFGDSITQDGRYVIDVELFLRTRFPDREFTVINHGISSQTVSGLSEPDHDPPRANALDRFSRDVNAWKPDVLVACFGMNDGIYHPFDPDRFAAYQTGIRTLIERTRTETAARLVLLTPPPYDPYRRNAGDPRARHYGYKFPVIDYDAVLTRYAEWLNSLRGPDCVVADVHALTTRHLEARRRDVVSFHVAPDSVHPNATGHWLMAQALLEAWNAPSEVDRLVVDLETRRIRAGSAVLLDVRPEGAVRLRWRTRLPFPVDPECDPESLRLERVSERWNRHLLTVPGASPGRYRLSARLVEDAPAAESAAALDPLKEFVVVGEVAADDLAVGVNLTLFPEFPTNQAARDVRTRLKAVRNEINRRWRSRIQDAGAEAAASPSPEDDAALSAIQALCRPRWVEIDLAMIRE